MSMDFAKYWPNKPLDTRFGTIPIPASIEGVYFKSYIPSFFILNPFYIYIRYVSVS